MHLLRFDPWLSYGILVTAAVLSMLWIERPAQRWIKATFPPH
jgi:hypothetical protein